MLVCPASWASLSLLEFIGVQCFPNVFGVGGTDLSPIVHRSMEISQDGSGLIVFDAAQGIKGFFH